MNEFLPIKNKKIGILGAAKWNCCSKLANEFKAEVFISDNKDTCEYDLDKFPHELGNHSDKILDVILLLKVQGFLK